MDREGGAIRLYGDPLVVMVLSVQVLYKKYYDEYN